MRSTLRDTGSIGRCHRRRIPRLHKVIRIEPICFQLADDAIDIARRIPLAKSAGTGIGISIASRDKAMGRQSANDEVDVRQGTFLQRGFEIGDVALRRRRGAVGAVGGDEAVLPQQGNDEGHAGSGSLLDERVEAEGVAFRGRGVGVRDVAGLLEVYNVGVDDGAHGAVLGTQGAILDTQGGVLAFFQQRSRGGWIVSARYE